QPPARRTHGKGVGQGAPSLALGAGPGRRGPGRRVAEAEEAAGVARRGTVRRDAWIAPGPRGALPGRPPGLPHAIGDAGDDAAGRRRLPAGVALGSVRRPLGCGAEFEALE